MGLPVITTNWSGPTEFATADTAYLLPVPHLTPVDGLPGAPAGAQWAYIDPAHLARLMRHVVNNPQQAAAKGDRARAHVVRYYDQRTVARQVITHLRRGCALQVTGQRVSRNHPPPLPPFRFHPRQENATTGGGGSGNFTFEPVLQENCHSRDIYHCAS